MKYMNSLNLKKMSLRANKISSNRQKMISSLKIKTYKINSQLFAKCYRKIKVNAEKHKKNTNRMKKHMLKNSKPSEVKLI